MKNRSVLAGALAALLVLAPVTARAQPPSWSSWDFDLGGPAVAAAVIAASSLAILTVIVVMMACLRHEPPAATGGRAPAQRVLETSTPPLRLDVLAVPGGGGLSVSLPF